MVRQMLMVLLRIMGSQFMSILIGGVADTDKRLVESKLLEWLPSGTVSWRGGRDGLLLECMILTTTFLRKTMGDPAA
jgi:hypothetical protein